MLDAEIKVAEGMRDFARTLETSEDPDVVIAAAGWEKRCLEELDRLKKAKAREGRKAQTAGVGGR